jgi:cell division transport system permease protein
MGQFKTTWQHIRRSPYQAFAAILIMFFTCMVAGSFIIMAYASDKILNYFESKPQTTAFLKDDIKSEDVDSIKNKLLETGKAANIKYVSKEEALNIYREQNKNDPLLLEMVSSSILPASLEISAKEIRDLQILADIAKKEPLVDEVVYQKDIVNTLIGWTSSLRSFGFILVGFLVFVSILIILMVIGMKIAVRREEIEILRLVGASRWYIRWPFILEGMYYGFLGAVFAWGILYLLLIYFTPFLSSFLTGIPLFPISFMLVLYLLLTMIGGGVLVGIIGSFLAVWRYLKN